MVTFRYSDITKICKKHESVHSCPANFVGGKSADLYFVQQCLRYNVCTHVCEQSAHQTASLLSEIFAFLARAPSELRLVNHASKHALQPLSDAKFCVYLHSELEYIRSYMNVLISYDCSIIGDFYFLCVLELDVRYYWQVMTPNTHCSVFLISHLRVLTCTHNLKTTGHIWTFSISNNCSTIRDIPCVV